MATLIREPQTSIVESVPQYSNILWAGDFILNPSTEQKAISAATAPNVNNSGVYCADGVIYQADGANIVALERSIASDNIYSMRGIIQTANKKFGFLFPLENITTKQLLETLPYVFSLRLRAKKDSGAFDFKVALVKWAGTTNSLTRSIVSSWNADTTDPTLVANWDYVSGTVQSAVSLTTSYVNYDFDNISIPVSTTANNLGIFLFTDSAPTSTSIILDIQRLTMNKGSSAVETELLSKSNYLQICQRYYETSYEPTEAVGIDSTSGSIYSHQMVTGAAIYPNINFKTVKVKTPTVKAYAVNQGNYANNVDKINAAAGTQTVSAAVYYGQNNIGGFSLGGSVTAGDIIQFQWSADSRL